MWIAIGILAAYSSVISFLLLASNKKRGSLEEQISDLESQVKDISSGWQRAIDLHDKYVKKIETATAGNLAFIGVPDDAKKKPPRSS